MTFSMSVSVPSGYTSSIYGGAGGSAGPISPGGNFSGVTFVAVPGLGTLFVEDIGWNNGAWAVRINGSSNIWRYQGFGQTNIAIDISGSFTVAGTIASRLITNMADTGPLMKSMLTLVQATPALQTAWNADAMQTLYTMGYPRTCMYNVDPSCCQQFIAIMQSIQIGSHGQVYHDAKDTT
ncbi:MAG TPA: hypothetical protein VKT70_08755, partial [Stellaceae bacterium]|nr:hypothetical protein [Stellaceae bacterium]